jgi:hypothetical protein
MSASSSGRRRSATSRSRSDIPVVAVREELADLIERETGALDIDPEWAASVPLVGRVLL